MKIAENAEILVRGPNIFPGYWDRPEETAKVLRDGWFHYWAIRAKVDATGNWKIVGRIKNLIILGRGIILRRGRLKIRFCTSCRARFQVVVVGNGRGYLAGAGHGLK